MLAHVRHQRVYGLGVTVGTPARHRRAGRCRYRHRHRWWRRPELSTAASAAAASCSAGVDHGTHVFLSAIPGRRQPLRELGRHALRGPHQCDLRLLDGRQLQHEAALFSRRHRPQRQQGRQRRRRCHRALINCGTDCVGEIVHRTPASRSRRTPAVSSVIQPSGGACTWTAAGTCTFTAHGPHPDGHRRRSRSAGIMLTRHRRRLRLHDEQRTAGSIAAASPATSIARRDYDYGTVVALTPFPAPTACSSRWTGCSRLNGSTCFVDMTANHTVHKKFISGAHAGPLRLRATATGVSSCPASRRCRAPAARPRSSCPSPPRSRPVVTATPDVGSNFQWLGGTTVNTCIGKSTPCSVLMSANQSLVGSFSLNRHSPGRDEPAQRQRGRHLRRARSLRRALWQRRQPVHHDPELRHPGQPAGHGRHRQHLRQLDGHLAVQRRDARLPTRVCSFPLQGNVTVTPELPRPHAGRRSSRPATARARSPSPAAVAGGVTCGPTAEAASASTASWSR